ncbi:MAG: hypothetical protein ACK2U5_13455 [Candidatus Promineifilaceae bacterium]|jgi:hypothetical protein
MEGISASLIDLLFLFLTVLVMLSITVAVSLMIYGLFFKKKQ